MDDFDPEGQNYDYGSATAAGMIPEVNPVDGLKHWGSVVEILPEKFLILKGRRHPTWGLMEEAEKNRGYKIIKENGRYFSVPMDYKK